jgi:riboflavin kinase / FMN adenylyltransferase
MRMEFIRTLPIQSELQHAVTIGNFDGVHLGHQTVIQQLKYQAKILNIPATVIIFEPQPAEFFAPQQAPARLTKLREKLLAFQQYGVDKVVCLRFGDNLAKLEAKAFIQKILLNGLNIKYLVVGDDFHFGYQRRGNYQLLQNAAVKYDFRIEQQHNINFAGQRISSTRIRQALALGEFALVQELLGRAYSISGRVIYGQQRGRTIDFPTANIALRRHNCPLQGVFAVKIHGLQTYALGGVANLGQRPTVNGQNILLEVHIFDFNQYIYGQHIEVEFIAKIRPERKFASFVQLQQQIQLDAAQAKALLNVQTKP